MGKQKCVAPSSEGCWSTIKAPVPSCCLLPVASPVGGGVGGGVSGAPREALAPFSGPHLLALAPSQRPCPQQHHLWGSGLQHELWRHTDFQTMTTRTPGRASSPGGARQSPGRPRLLPLQGAPPWGAGVHSSWSAQRWVCWTVAAAARAETPGSPGDAEWCVGGGAAVSAWFLMSPEIAAALLVPISIRLCHLASPVVTMTF